MSCSPTTWPRILMILAAACWLLAAACVLPSMPPTNDDDDDDDASEDDDTGDDDTGDDDTGDDDTGDDDTGDDDTGDDDTGDDDTGDDDTGDDDTGDDDTGDDDTGDDDTGDDDTGDDDTTGDDDIALDPADDTNNAPVLTQPGTYLGDTSSLSDTYSDPSACTGWEATGFDGVYRIPLSANQTLDALIQYDQDLQDASIYISDDATAPDLNCLAGADIEYDNGLELLTYTAVNNGVYYLVVDGYFAGMGAAFSLEVSF